MKRAPAPADFLRDFQARPSPLQRLQGAQWTARGLQVWLKREDQRDAVLGGNKWCKLAGHLAAARGAGHERLLSVGGVWSNHLHALAHAGQRYGFATTALVRGERFTPMLQEAQAAGMQLEFVGRDSYRQRHEPVWQAAMAARHQAYFIAEGGAGAAGQQGLQALAAEILQQTAAWQAPWVLALPVGSGTTLLGLQAALPATVTIWGFQAFADAGLAARLQAGQQAGAARWHLWTTPAMRQHRQLPAALQAFQQDFEQAQAVALDPVYTVRMFWQLQQLLPVLAPGSRVLALHTGGLQGRRGQGLSQVA